MGASKIILDISKGIATITLNRPHHLNALTSADYDDFANALRMIDKREDVVATIWQANGSWFCAGTDVKATNSQPIPLTVRDQLQARVIAANTDCTQALYRHSKVLVAALNGPVMGIAAAFLGNFDFIYALPEAWLYLGFPLLGIALEGGASVTFINRVGLATANELLIFSKKKTAQELVECGFINKIFRSQPTESFHAAVREHVLSELDGLVPESVLAIKSLVKASLAEENNPDAVNLRESYAQAERFATGIPATRFGMIARKEIKHKL